CRQDGLLCSPTGPGGKGILDHVTARLAPFRVMTTAFPQVLCTVSGTARALAASTCPLFAWSATGRRQPYRQNAVGGQRPRHAEPTPQETHAVVPFSL